MREINGSHSSKTITSCSKWSQQEQDNVTSILQKTRAGKIQKVIHKGISL